MGEMSGEPPEEWKQMMNDFIKNNEITGESQRISSLKH
jgi:hypothetical protein